MGVSRRRLLQAGLCLVGAGGAGWGLRMAVSQGAPRLRPPGAGAEAEFLSRCIRCTQCVAACPIDVLQLAPPSDGIGCGTPFLVPLQQPCDLCQGRERLFCIDACPTAALRPLKDRRDVRIGIAVVDAETCLPFVGVSCKACWHACPFPSEAIVFDGMGRPVVTDQCVGCGLCEYVCLTSPPSIRVVCESPPSTG